MRELNGYLAGLPVLAGMVSLAEGKSPPDMEEPRQALTEAISLYLSEPGDVKHVELEDEPGSVTEHRMLARTA
jgi:hypothetical protein